MTGGGTIGAMIAHPVRLLTADMSVNPQQTMKEGLTKLEQNPFAKFGAGTRNASFQFASYAATPALLLATADALGTTTDGKRPSDFPIVRVFAGFAAGITDTAISGKVDLQVTRSAIPNPKDMFTGSPLGSTPGPVSTQYRNLLVRNLPLGVVTIASELVHDALPKDVQDRVPRGGMVGASVFVYNMTYGHVTNMAKTVSQMTTDTSVSMAQSFYRAAELLNGTKEPRTLSTPTSMTEGIKTLAKAFIENPRAVLKTAGPRAGITFVMATGIGAGIRGFDGTINTLILCFRSE